MHWLPSPARLPFFHFCPAITSGTDPRTPTYLEVKHGSHFLRRSGVNNSRLGPGSDTNTNKSRLADTNIIGFPGGRKVGDVFQS